MKNKVIVLALAGALGVSFSAEAFKKGVSTYPGTAIETHIFSETLCKQPTTYAGLLPAAKAKDNIVFTLWGDPGMWAATGIDILATNKNRTKTVKAKDAINKLKEALEGGSGSSGSSDSTTTDADTAEIYTPENIEAVIELTEKKSDDLFESVRQEVAHFSFATADADIKKDCTNKDSDCAEERQNQWLLASVTLASATADKILETTVKSGEQDKTDENGQTTTQTTGATTPLKAHFEKLASDFNGQTVPTGMYDAMANIVLDTHRQMNEANALLGRDLEAQGLRSITETGHKNLKETEE